MKDKIKLILHNEGLTTTRFAEMLGIQPSAVSHLVSGRNKPGCDLLQRILQQFPRISADWFMRDIGAPYKDQATLIEDSADNSNLFNALKIENNEPQVEPVVNMGFSEAKAPEQIAESKLAQPVRVMVFYDDGTFESYSLRG